MLRVYCHNYTTNETKLILEPFSYSEAIQFIYILVSAHGYDYHNITVHEDAELNRSIYAGYSDQEFCYIVEEYEDE